MSTHFWCRSLNFKNLFSRVQKLNSQKTAILSNNKKSHWLEFSVSKLLGDSSGNIEMLNGYLDKTCRSKTEKLNNNIEFCIFKLVWVPDFSLNRQISTFWIKFAKKVHFLPKTKKVNITTKFELV